MGVDLLMLVDKCDKCSLKPEWEEEIFKCYCRINKWLNKVNIHLIETCNDMFVEAQLFRWKSFLNEIVTVSDDNNRIAVMIQNKPFKDFFTDDDYKNYYMFVYVIKLVYETVTNILFCLIVNNCFFPDILEVI